MTIQTISLKNFKSFESLDLKLTNLNILAGSNSVGKSTVIQSLLLLKQNRNSFRMPYSTTDKKEESYQLNRFDINGELVELGNENALLYIDAQDDQWCITVNDEYCCLQLGRELNLPCQVQVQLKPEAFCSQTNIYLLGNYRFPQFSYLSTHREPPKIIYPLSNHDVANHSLGIYGQYTAHYLATEKSTPLSIKALKHPASKTDLLLENVSCWLGQISENVDVTAKVIPEANQAAITYSYSYGNNKSREITPLNVGFGVTHTLPVVTLLLMAKVGDTLIIENPEAHLHPKGQANLAQLISLVAEQGVQVIVETHSDHIINGIRVATKKGIIKPEHAKIYFFEHIKDSLAAKATEITIDSDGGVSQWPQGFFDEWDNQLDELLW